MDLSLLRKVHIFSKLSDEDLEKIAGICHLKTYNKNDIIFFDTEPYLGFYIVSKGLVKIYKISKEGREHILHLINPYNTFAEVPLFENLGEILSDDFRYPANSMALEDNTQVVLIPAKQFTEIITNIPSISLRMLSGFAKRLRNMNRHIEEITLKDVTKRIASFILNEYGKEKHSKGEIKHAVSLNLSRADLASYLGTVIETLSRTLKKLQNEEIILVEGKKIYIKDIEKLKHLAL